MKKGKSLIIAIAEVLAFCLLTGCSFGGGNTSESPEPEVTATISPAGGQETSAPDPESPDETDAPAVPSELPATPTATPAPTPTNTPSPTPQITETSYAYITSWNERMDVYQDYAFDYVDWLFDQEAVDKYMQDYGCSREEAEEETEEYGYIRNVNPQIRWFSPTDSTEYYMPDAIMSVTPVKVDYETFRDRMIPAIDNNETWLTFVKVTVAGENIVKIEWVFHP